MESIPFSQSFFQNLQSVEMYIPPLDQIYQFKIWGNSLTSLFVLVREDSDLVGQLGVGDLFEMTFHTKEASGSRRSIPTRIKYIHKIDQGRFKGHYLTGLAIERTAAVTTSAAALPHHPAAQLSGI